MYAVTDGLKDRHSYSLSQQPRKINPDVALCWSTVADGGPTWGHLWFDVSCVRWGLFSLPCPPPPWRSPRDRYVLS